MIFSSNVKKKIVLISLRILLKWMFNVRLDLNSHLIGKQTVASLGHGLSSPGDISARFSFVN